MMAGYITYVENLRGVFGIFCLVSQILKVSSYNQELGGNPDRSECHLATPGVTFFMNEEDVRVSVAKNLLKDGEKAWVGYALKPVYLQYLGCIYLEDIENKITYDETPAAADLGICYRICYNRYKPVMGILGRGQQPCKCFGEDIKQFNITSPGCTKPCRNDKFLCGGYSAVSLYQEVTVDLVNASVEYSGDDKCLSIYDTEYSWEYCNMLYKPICNTGKGQTNKRGSRSNPWRSSVKQCFDRGWSPLGYMYNKDVQVGPKTYWTGVVQTRTLIQLWEWPPAPSDLKYGYAEKVGNDYILKYSFDRDFTNTSICHRDISKTSVQPGISTKLSTNRTDKDEISVMATQSSISMIPSLEHTGDTNSSDSDRDLKTEKVHASTTNRSNKSNIREIAPVNNKNNLKTVGGHYLQPLAPLLRDTHHTALCVEPDMSVTKKQRTSSKVDSETTLAVYILIPIAVVVLVVLLFTAICLIRYRSHCPIGQYDLTRPTVEITNKGRDRNKGHGQTPSQKLLDDGSVTFNRQECVSITDANSPSEIVQNDIDDDDNLT